MTHDEEFWREWLEEHKEFITYNQDGSIDVDGNVNISCSGIFTIILEFNIVNGYFICSDNYLTSLKNSPKMVYGYFDCGYNKLSNLKYLPTISFNEEDWFHYESNLYINNNPLQSFEGLDIDKIYGDIYIENYRNNVDKNIIKAIQNNDTKWLLLNNKNYKLNGYNFISKYLKGDLFK